MRSKLHLIANETGSFRGLSANISGTGFAGMRFTAQSCSEEEFHQWVQEVKQSPKHLDMDVYDQLVQPSEYQPAAYYLLMQENLFDRVLMKYMTPG
jgi:cytochrome o ubiquinol oxidase subunit 2